jgi:nucleoside-diphosphate-sugar epimerase
VTKKRKILIAGALGTVGRCALEHFEKLSDWDIIGAARRKPDFETRAEWIQVDLRDAADCKAKLAGVNELTSIGYMAVYEKADVTRGWSEMDHVQINLGMLINLVENVERASPNLHHITLLQGTKAYGGHLGPFRQPARESDPRYMPPNFYYDQMDWIAERKRNASWTWSVLRPQIVCGIAIGSPLNIITAIGVFAAISREYGMPLRFPGGVERISEATDARLIAKAIEWAVTSPNSANQVFNVTNGDIYVWHHVFPRIAELFGMEMAPPHPFSLARVMPQNEPVWDRIVAKYRLQPYKYKEIVPSWQFADFLLGYGQRPNPHHMSTIKIRKAGFHDCIDSEQMFVELIGELQSRRILPGCEAMPA